MTSLAFFSGISFLMGSSSSGRVEGLRKKIPEMTNGNNPRELSSEQVGKHSIKQCSAKMKQDTQCY